MEGEFWIIFFVFLFYVLNLVYYFIFVCCVLYVVKWNFIMEKIKYVRLKLI